VRINAVGSMWCAYVFAAIALIGLPGAIAQGTLGIVQWIAQTLLQLVLLPIIIVGQNVQAAASDKRALRAPTKTPRPCCTKPSRSRRTCTPKTDSCNSSSPRTNRTDRSRNRPVLKLLPCMTGATLCPSRPDGTTPPGEPEFSERQLGRGRGCPECGHRRPGWVRDCGRRRGT